MLALMYGSLVLPSVSLMVLHRAPRMDMLILGLERPVPLPASRLWGRDWSDWDLSDGVVDGAWLISDISV